MPAIFGIGVDRRGAWGGAGRHCAGAEGAEGIRIGAEGKGLGRLVKENCDILVKIPMRGGVSSLNASAAGAILLFEIVRQRAGE